LAQGHRAQQAPREKAMSLFDDTPSDPLPDPSSDPSSETPHPEPAPHSSEEPHSADPGAPSLSGDPITYAARVPDVAYDPNSLLPEDLRISWYWPHLILFLFFTGASFVIVQTALFFYYGPSQPLPKEELEKYLLNKPQFIFGTNILWYASVFFFLYITLGVLRDSPFWSSLGWKKLKARLPGSRGGPWAYFFSGCILAVGVFPSLPRLHTNENMPIEELFKNRENAILLMCMAVFVAPLVEETVFRGYLYPLFARMAYAVTRRFGMEASEAVGAGMTTSILLTGVLFGLMHGSQLGWTWQVVSLLVVVGIIFTFVRARTGTVLASFLLHLGYNSMIAVTTIIGTHGFTRIPTSP
jgi:membrane protease YdiL (CAAX protease family)